MPSFAYNLRTAAGQTETGVLKATDAAAASASLRDGGNLLLTLEPASEAVAPQRTAPRISRLPFVRPRLATLEVALLQISVMLASGLTLLEALRATAAQSPRLTRETLIDLAERVQEGRTLSQAMERHPWMGRMVRQLVEVGEQTGSLDLVLERAAEALERRRLLISQSIAALTYPAIVLILAVTVTCGMLFYAVPRLTTYLRTLGRPLPTMTQVLVDASNFLLVWWPVVLGATAVATICFAVAYSVPPGRLVIDRFILRLPILGTVFRTSATALFSRSFSLLLVSGVTIIEALRTCQELHRNRALTVLIAAARENVIAGAPLAPGLAAAKTFMPMLSSMVAIGEKSGNLDHTLESCAKFHEQRLESLIRRLSAIAEIAVILVVGGIVGYVYIAFLWALYGAAI